ncbi:DUF1254 domain-containing protein [bacterium]|jgi:hypothetical protein|nr:DUF1254 domain-containing protein [bacterium]
MYNVKSRFSRVSALMVMICLFPSALKSSPLHAADRSLKYEMTVQRACEAAIWAMPAVSVYDIELSIQRDLGGKFGDVAYFSKPMTSRHGFLTANDVTPYVTSGLSCKGDPLVIEVPPAGEKVSYFGTIVDGWQTPLADVGPPGDDKGKGGKYLFLPPGYEGKVPKGYLVYRPLTYGVHFAFRPVAKNGGTHADQAAYAQTLKVYRLSQAARPPKTNFVDAYPKKWNTLPVYDFTFFTDLNSVIQREPVIERDKAMMALLAGIGIEKGKEFKPDAARKKAMLEGLQRAYDWMQDYFINRSTVAWWQNRQWQVWQFAKGQPEAGFPYVTEDRVLIDERGGGAYFWITYLPKVLGGGSFYLTGLRDKDGELMNGKDTYKLNVPADTPAKDFWSVIVYSMKSKGFVEDVDRVGLSSLDISKMKKNSDGSVDVYFAPKAPQGLENNWIPTGEAFFLLFRLYGPEKPLFEKSWTLSDIEKVR